MTARPYLPRYRRRDALIPLAARAVFACVAMACVWQIANAFPLLLAFLLGAA